MRQCFTNRRIIIYNGAGLSAVCLYHKGEPCVFDGEYHGEGRKLPAKNLKEREEMSMKEKIKIMSVNTKKKGRRLRGVKDSGISMAECIEQLVPGMYTFREVYAGDAVETAETLRPEIIWILLEASGDCLDLLEKLKRVHPEAAVFVMFVGPTEDEQEVINAYSASGAYKCYFLPPFILNTLVHDMYVALNLE